MIGMLAALLESRLSGEGQVVDAAIVDGTAHLNAMASGFLAGGTLREERAANLLDGGMPFYDLYETSDGRHMSVGPARAAVLRRVRRPARDRGRARPLRLRPAPRAAPPDRRGLRGAHHGGVDRGVRGHRRLRGAGADADRGGRPPAHGGPRGLRRARRACASRRPPPGSSRTPAELSSPPPGQAGHDTREALAAWGIDDVDGLLERGVAVQA